MTSGLRDGVSKAVVTGQTALRLVDMTFEVLATAAAGTVHERVLNMTVDSMVNQGTFEYLAAAQAQVNDMRGGAQQYGVLQVQPVSVVGVLAYASVAELVNLAVLGGAEVESSISVVQLVDRASVSPSLASADAFDCSVDSSASAVSVDRSAGCLVRITDGQRAGVAVTSVAVRSLQGGVGAVVPLRVWYPSEVTVQAEDHELSQIVGLRVSTDCSRPAYQSTTLTAVATFGGPGLPALTDVDVSRLVSFDASSGAVSVSGQTATGQSVGGATITLLQASTVVVPLSVTVTDSTVSVVALRGVVITGVEWAQRPPSQVEWAPVSTQMSASVRLLQQLTQEG